MPGLALSSRWMQKRFETLNQFLEAGNKMGFNSFELSQNIRENLLLDCHFSSDIHIVSIYAPCPTNVLTLKARLSSTPSSEREEAVKGIKNSVSLAAQLGAEAVVFNGGRVTVNPMLETDLRVLYDAGKKGSGEYDDLAKELSGARRDRVSEHMDSLRRSLDEVVKAAQGVGIKLGLKNRGHYYEIPLPDELDSLLSDFDGALFFWYDSGHAQVLEELGFVEHTEWLKGFGSRVIGAHLHDVRKVSGLPEGSTSGKDHLVKGMGLREYLVPGDGDVDFSELASYIPPDSIKVCEFEWYTSCEEIKKGVEILKESGL